MANTNQSVRTCVLKVDIKCCTGCQKKASTRLQTLSGVTAVEYNAEKGLMTVTGDVDPMTLIDKLKRWGKKPELVSVKYQIDDLTSDEEDDTSSSDTSSNPDSKPMKRETQVEKMPPTRTANNKKGLLRKSLLLGCFSSKSKVLQPLPMPNRNWRVPSKFENPNGPPGYHPFANAATSSSWGPPRPLMSYPHPMMQQQPHPMMQQQPYPMTMQQQSHAPMPQNATMFPQAQPPTQPYFMKVNPKLHYSS